MINELLTAKQGTKLRKNKSEVLKITIDQNELMNIFLINGNSFKIENISQSDLTIKPNNYYMMVKIQSNYPLMKIFPIMKLYMILINIPPQKRLIINLTTLNRSIPCQKDI